MHAAQGPPSKVGWDETESKEFLRAIKQPLLVQTPLQVILETLFSKLQAQALALNDLKLQVQRVAVKDVQADELLERLRMVEDGFKGMAAEQLSPFNQAEVLVRLEAVEVTLGRTVASSAAAVATSGQAATEPAKEHSTFEVPRVFHGEKPLVPPDLEPRLERIEQKLAGVYNLSGRLVAMEQVCQEMGVDIPNLEYPTGHSHLSPPSTASPNPPLPNRANASLWPQAGGPLTPGLEQAQMLLSTGLGMAPSVQGSGILPPPVASLMSNAAEAHTRAVTSLAGDGSAVSPRGGQLAGAGGSVIRGSLGGMLNGGGGGGPMSAAAGMAGRTGSPLTTQLQRQLQQQQQQQQQQQRPGSGMMGQVSSDVQGLRREHDELRANVEHLMVRVVGLEEGLREHKEAAVQQMAKVEETTRSLSEALNSDASALRRDAHKAPDVTFADLSALKSQVEAAVAEVAAGNAAVAAFKEKDLPEVVSGISELRDAVRRAAEPRDMDTLFHTRLTAVEAVVGDLRTEVQAGVQEAMDGVAKVEELHAVEDELGSKAAASDVARLAAQQQHLAHSLAALSETLAVRTEALDAQKGPTGPVATRFRCLTCDQPIKNAPAAPVPGRNNLLPRLDGVLPAGTPVGPGINAAELRRAAEEKGGGGPVGPWVSGIGGMAANGRGAGGSPPRLGDVEAYMGATGISSEAGGSANGGGSMAGGRVERARAVRVAVGGSSVTAKPGTAPRTPVFL